jgi:multidrug efflux pump subunit AcrA (membrane-fusion protein)
MMITRAHLHRALPLVLLVSSAGCGARTDTAATETAAPAPLAITTIVAEGRSVPDVLALSGTLVADEDSRLSPVLPGRVVEVLVDRGAIVEEGQPLVRMRDVDYRLQSQGARAQLAQARARLGIEPGARPPAADDTPEVRSARASLQLAEDALRRAEELAQRGVLPPAQLDEARARASQARDQHAVALQNVRAAIASLGAAEAQLSIASTALAESLVRAPFAGEIAERSVAPGEYVTVQTPLLTLVRTDPLRLELQVPQERIASIHEGQRVALTVDAYPGTLFEGQVRYVSAAVDRASRAMVVEAVIPNGDRRLRPGMFAEARIALGGERPVAVVPPAAVLTSAGVSRAFVVRDGRIEERVVTVLERSAAEVVVTQGVSGGEVLASSRLDGLADGAAVTVGAAAASAPAQPPAAAGTGS